MSETSSQRLLPTWEAWLPISLWTFEAMLLMFACRHTDHRFKKGVGNGIVYLGPVLPKAAPESHSFFHNSPTGGRPGPVLVCDTP